MFATLWRCEASGRVWGSLGHPLLAACFPGDGDKRHLSHGDVFVDVCWT